jgi:hypothetical protein
MELLIWLTYLLIGVGMLVYINLQDDDDEPPDDGMFMPC